MTSKEEAQKRLEKAEAAVDEMRKLVDQHGQKIQEQQATIDRMAAEGKAADDLRVALRGFLFPDGLPQGGAVAGASGLRVTHTPQEVLVTNDGKETVEYTTKERKGQILWVLLHDLKHPSSESMIGEAMIEYSWPGSHNALKDIISDMVRDHVLIMDTTNRPALYRTPGQVDFKAKDKPEK